MIKLADRFDVKHLRKHCENVLLECELPIIDRLLISKEYDMNISKVGEYS
jgi:hypothetical protein